jgi:hypothetical protein
MLSFLFLLIGFPFIVLFVIGFLTYDDKKLTESPASPSPTAPSATSAPSSAPKPPA